MAEPNFPNNPAVNDETTVNGKTFRWDGDKWRQLPFPALQPTAAQVTYDNALSGLAATRVDNALDELDADVSALEALQANKPRLYAKDLGVVGAATEGAATDVSTAMEAALDQANNEDKLLVLQGGKHYRFSITKTPTTQYNLALTAEGGEPAYIHPVSGSDIILRVSPDGDGAVNTVSITADIAPGDKIITVDSTAALEKGMAVQWSSNVVWPYDGRGIWNKGDIGVISRIISSTQFELEAFSYDAYDVGTETLTFRYWKPSKLYMSNIEFRQVAPASDTGRDCVRLDRFQGGLVKGVTVRDASGAGMVVGRCIDTTVVKFGAFNIGREGNVGYGISVLSSLGFLLDGLYSHAHRRGIDFNSFSSTNSAPCRRYIVRNFFVNGGGEEPYNSTSDLFYPNGGVTHDGVGTHGPSEDGLFCDGIISHTTTGITVRGRNTRIRNVEFGPNVNDCIGFSYGTGLDVQGCSVHGCIGPDRAPTSLNNLPESFVRFGGTSGDFGAPDYSIPVVIQNNTLYGLRKAFLKFNSTADVTRLIESDNVVYARPGSAEDFYYLHSPFGVTDISESVLDSAPPTMARAEGSGSLSVDANITLAQRVDPDSPVRVGDNTWFVWMNDDDYVTLQPRVYQYMPSVSAVISGAFEESYRADFQLFQGSGTPTNTGFIGSGVNVTSGALTSGTSGPDTFLNINYSTTGRVSMSNRTGGPIRLILTLR